MINVFHIVSGCNFLRKRRLLSRDRYAHTAKRMCPTEPCTTGETPRARTSAKVIISCSTFSNADHGYVGLCGLHASAESRPVLKHQKSKPWEVISMYSENGVSSLHNYHG